MKVIFVTGCAVDFCYKKKLKGSAFCKEHKKEWESGKQLSVEYGRKVQKKSVATLHADR